MFDMRVSIFLKKGNKKRCEPVFTVRKSTYLLLPSSDTATGEEMNYPHIQYNQR
jgi:hypothetical protein